MAFWLLWGLSGTDTLNRIGGKQACTRIDRALGRIRTKIRGQSGASTRESSMTRRLLLVASAGVMWVAFLAGGGVASGAAQTSTALTGRVSSAEEGAMEGVVGSAKKAGSMVTVSVVSDERGRFAFPSSKLGSGSYSLKIRATGYELDGQGSVEITLALPVEVDLKLRKVRDITPRMTNAEWIASFPGTPEQKKFLYGCVGCHTLGRVAKSKHDAAGSLQGM